MPSKLLLFDLDWTVIHTGGAGIRALDKAFLDEFSISEAMQGITPDGKTDPAIVREMILTHLQRDPQEGEIESVCRRYVDHLLQEVATTPHYTILPGIPELLRTLSTNNDVLIGLGTGNLQAGARAKLARSALGDYFKFGGFGDDSESRPDVLRAGVQRGEALGGKRFAPKDVVVIGDHFRDIQAARAIGAKMISVATGRLSESELQSYQPDVVFKDLSNTSQVLNALLS